MFAREIALDSSNLDRDVRDLREVLSDTRLCRSQFGSGPAPDNGRLRATFLQTRCDVFPLAGSGFFSPTWSILNETHCLKSSLLKRSLRYRRGVGLP